jgi:hypothetical protein
VVLEDDKSLCAKAAFRSGRDLCSPEEQAWRKGEGTKGDRDLRFGCRLGRGVLAVGESLEGGGKGSEEKVSAPW